MSAQRAKVMKFKDGYMISTGEPKNLYITVAKRNVLMKQGVMGLQVEEKFQKQNRFKLTFFRKKSLQNPIFCSKIVIFFWKFRFRSKSCFPTIRQASRVSRLAFLTTSRSSSPRRRKPPLKKILKFHKQNDDFDIAFWILNVESIIENPKSVFHMDVLIFEKNKFISYFFLLRSNLISTPANLNSASPITPKSSFSCPNSNFSSTKIFILP